MVGFAALIVVMLLVYEGIEREPAKIHMDRLPSQGAPDSWATRQHDESSNTTETEYAINYGDCSLFMSKDSSAALTETVMTVMTCAREVRTINPDYGGPDFAAIWEDMGSCGVFSYEVVEGTDGDVDHVFIVMRCRD